MSPGWRIGALALAFGCVWLLPAPAALGGEHYTAPAGHETRFELRGSNGYRVTLYANDRGAVTIRVAKEGSSTEYTVRGAEVGRYGVKARFADLGRVQFRFIPNGRRRRVSPPPWCEGPAAVVREGAAVGRIRFRGEADYTRVSADRAQAEVEVWPRWNCHALGPEKGPRRWAASFDAFREQQPIIGFLATRFKKRFSSGSKRVLFLADTGSVRGRVRIYHSAAVFADSSTFRVPDPEGAPENIVIEPPPPFSGTGSLRRTGESVFAWEGDLSVSFPGAAPLSLTGPSFETNYCAEEACVSQDSYEEGESPSRLPLLR